LVRVHQVTRPQLFNLAANDSPGSQGPASPVDSLPLVSPLLHDTLPQIASQMTCQSLLAVQLEWTWTMKPPV
jgi:hypothetical protein